MIKPVYIISGNIAKELTRIAAQNRVSSSSLCLKINAISTMIKDGNTDFIRIEYEDLDKYTNEESLRDLEIEFAQEYDVSIQSHYENYPFKNMKTEIELEDNGTLAYLVIKKGSKLNFNRDLYDDFLNYIIEQQMRSNILVYLFDVDYHKTIKDFVDVIAKIKKITFKEDKKILISKGLSETPSVSAEVSMIINAKEEEGEHSKVNYSDRGFLVSCIEGDELFEFIKPKQGKHGRNCRGKIIEVEQVDIDAQPDFSVNNGIEIQDSFENIKYLSTKSGYLLQDGDQYDVSNSIDVDEISFKTTGTIDTDLDTEISIRVVKDDPLEDAIEKGMSVRVQNLSIEGSIGPHTHIEARNVYISGQTHNDSSIKCVDAEINLLKGKVTARVVEVKTLEGGEIIADKTIVTNAMSGTIKAKTIEITLLGSHVVLEASEYIKIQKIRGEENKFILDASIESGFDDKKQDDGAYLNKINDEIDVLVKTFKVLTQKVKGNLEPCKKIKGAIVKAKTQGIKISSVLIKNYKVCQVMHVHYKKLKEEIVYKKSQTKQLEEKLSDSSLDVLDSQLILNESVRGHNNITYKLSNPQREITLNINESMNKKIFKLIEDDEGVLKIINTN